MSDREKVIRGLEWILQDDKFGFGENWDSGEPQCDEEKAGKIIWDTLTLLKAQEPVKPIIKQEMDDICSCIDDVAYCGECGALIGRLKQNYCHECGRKVKWDEE